MILDSIFNFFLNCFEGLLSTFFGNNIVNFVIPDNVFSACDSLFSCIGYLFPISGLLPILVLSVALTSFHIIYALVLRIYNIFWGS